MYVPKYFNLPEFIVSATAIRGGIDNTPNFSQVYNLSRLCQLVLDPARASLKAPINVSSGYRCASVNKIAGGVRNSQHMYGLAADIHTTNLTALFDILKANKEFDQLILYKSQNFIHVSVPFEGSDPRHQIIIKSRLTWKN